MDEHEVRVIQKHMKDILEGVHMEEKLLSAFLERDLFTVSMVDSIRAGKTDGEKLFSMMTLLMKRGPDAFKAFTEIIEEDYNWLAKRLRQSYREETEEIDSMQGKTDDSERSEDKKGEGEKETSVTFDLKHKQSKSKRHSVNQHDHKPSGFSFIQSSLDQLYTKVKARNDLCMYRRETTEISMATPEPVTFRKLDEQLEELFHRMDALEHLIKQVNALLGITSHHGDTMTVLFELQRTKRNLEKQIQQKDQQKNKYCDRINKLESSCRDQLSKIEWLEKEVARLNEELHKCAQEDATKTQDIETLTATIAVMDAKLKLKAAPGRGSSQRAQPSLEMRKLQEEIKKLKKDNKRLKDGPDSGETSDKTQTLVKDRPEGRSGGNGTETKSVAFADPLVTVHSPVNYTSLPQKSDSDDKPMTDSKLDENDSELKKSGKSKRARENTGTRHSSKVSTSNGTVGPAQPTNKHKTKLMHRLMVKKHSNSH